MSRPPEPCASAPASSEHIPPVSGGVGALAQSPGSPPGAEERGDTSPRAPHLKRCSRCRTAKPIDTFYPDGRNRDGRQSTCRRCHGETQRGRSLRSALRDFNDGEIPRRNPSLDDLLRGD